MTRLLASLSAFALLDGVSAFQAGAAGYHSSSSAAVSLRGSQHNINMMPAAAVLEKKAKVVEEVKETMENSMLMFCVRSEGITVNDLNMMRQKIPEDVTMRCVKNTLVKRAAEEVPKFQGGDSLLEYSNYWFFCPEGTVREAYETWNDFVKESGNDDYAIVGGIFEGEALDEKGVEAITKLPTKQELMGQTAVLLKALPTKLARTLDQAGAQRLARVTKQASGQKLVQAVKAMEGKKE